MSSVFSFSGTPTTSAAPAASAAALQPLNSPLLDQASAALLAALNRYLPAPAPPLPTPSVSLVSIADRAVGLGQHVGTDRRGSLGLVEVKGGFLDTVVRFQLWASGPDVVELAGNDLFQRIMADRANLWNEGFLRIEMATTSPAEFMAGVNAWRIIADYRLLYEYRYQDTDGAESLIARIPIHADPEERNSLQRETSVVTDEMTRWDEQDAPGLIVHGPFAIGRLSALSFFASAAPNGAVMLTRTFEGATGTLIIHPTLAAFLAAVGGPNPIDRHAQIVFPTLSDFLAALDPVQDTLTLGDWNVDGTLDEYTARSLALTPTIRLTDNRDRFEITYQNAALNQVGVVYVRATRL